MLEKQAQEIKEFISSISEERVDAVQPTREQFTRLLSEPTASRKVPGIPYRMNETENYHCSEEEAAETKEFLSRMFQIDSKDSLIAYQQSQFRGSVHYEQFMTFWKEAPLFDINELNPNGRKVFEMFMCQAKAFYPMLQEHGFYAWDISEYIGICRVANACGIISDQEFEEIVDHFVRKAQVFYHSFKEYALSYLCGALYFMVLEGDNPDGIDHFLDLQKQIVSNLFEEDAPWQYYAWYRPRQREWAQIYPGDSGCFLTKSALEKGIEYMYREQGSSNYPDSGWRFFHGDESDDYVNNQDNIQIVSLNTICNLRPDILAYLEAPVDSAYGWDGKDWIKE